MESGQGIAIVGMSGRFPGARNIAEFWNMLREGRAGVRFIDDAELLAAGVPAETIRQPNFVRATATLEEVDRFDAEFFQISEREAELIDPQHRLFLEACWEAMEDAGVAPLGGNRSVGVFAGCSINTYLLQNLLPRLGAELSLAGLQAGIASDKDFLSTRVSYRLDLQGPSLTVQTACSTSLVAVHLAVQSLMLGECDMALAGGSSVRAGTRGYSFEEGSILSPDGHCRAFDEKGQGTVPGNGVGVVLLQRLEDALEQGSPIYAVIRGSAVTNDGAQKIGYTAPSVVGQARAITEAMAVAGVEPESISYIEAHGTGTALGDPIEIEALTAAHGEEARRTPCAIGALKSNVGHMDAAAGIGGLIKTALALHHRELPPSLHYTKPNPKIDFAKTRFGVNASLKPWAASYPRRAGVSSFGMGGSNAHAILEEAPERFSSPSARPQHLLALSARTSHALKEQSERLAQYLETHPSASLADVAHTLSVGRVAFANRTSIAAATASEAIANLKKIEPQVAGEETLPVAFLFPGQGSQHIGMAKELYATEPVFREWLDRGAEILTPLVGEDIRPLVFSNGTNERLAQTALTQPILFCFEYALAQLWKSWGVKPEAMIGHSIGEFVAASLAGVFSFEDGVKLVAERGRLLQALPAGAMVSVASSPEELGQLPAGVSLAAVNAPGRSIVSGTFEGVAAAVGSFRARGLECRELATSHAFHSEMMRPAADAFRAAFAGVRLSAPQSRYLSNVTGAWITAAQATSPDYWVEHLLSPVRFGAGVLTLLREREYLFVEVGPGRALGTFVKRTGGGQCVASLPHPEQGGNDARFALSALGKVWALGGDVNLAYLYRDEKRLRVSLPTYPFQRKRFWIEAPRKVSSGWEEPVAEEPVPTREFSETEEWTEVEKVVAVLWEEILGVKEVTRQANFFELGGDSVAALQIVNQLSSKLPIRIPVHTLLASATIEAFSRQVEDLLIESMEAAEA